MFKHIDWDVMVESISNIEASLFEFTGLIEASDVRIAPMQQEAERRQFEQTVNEIVEKLEANKQSEARESCLSSLYTCPYEDRKDQKLNEYLVHVNGTIIIPSFTTGRQVDQFSGY